MYIFPTENWQGLKLSPSQTKLMEAVGEKANVRHIVKTMGLSIPAAVTLVKLLVSKGALRVTNP